jgi:hypothetical protein
MTTKSLPMQAAAAAVSLQTAWQQPQQQRGACTCPQTVKLVVMAGRGDMEGHTDMNMTAQASMNMTVMSVTMTAMNTSQDVRGGTTDINTDMKQRAHRLRVLLPSAAAAAAAVAVKAAAGMHMHMLSRLHCL